MTENLTAQYFLISYFNVLSSLGPYLTLLKALPAMAADKNCVALILRLVGSLAVKPHLTPLRLRLLLNLWRQEPR